MERKNEGPIKSVSKQKLLKTVLLGLPAPGGRWTNDAQVRVSLRVGRIEKVSPNLEKTLSPHFQHHGGGTMEVVIGGNIYHQGCLYLQPLVLVWILFVIHACVETAHHSCHLISYLRIALPHIALRSHPQKQDAFFDGSRLCARLRQPDTSFKTRCTHATGPHATGPGGACWRIQEVIGPGVRTG